VLSCFDRVIIRGHLPMAAPGYFSAWLWSKKISTLAKPPAEWWPFKEAAPGFAEDLKSHAKAMATAAGRPYLPLQSSQRMEANARAMAERDGIADGLVCIHAVNEKARTFAVRWGEGRPPRVVTDLRVCSHIYYYVMDREYGLMHIKVQTWFPFTVQVYVNGHEWLARQLDKAGIAYRKVDNAFVWIEDVARAQRCADRFERRDWPKLLACLAERVNPLLKDWLAGQSYYWALDQVEYSTDVLFRARSALESMRPHLYEHAAKCLGAEQLMMFLGRKYCEQFAGEVTTRWHRREPGGAVKHYIKGNAIKMYDKAGLVLRIETVINRPHEFRVYRHRNEKDRRSELGWYPMNKGVANLYRCAEVGRAANARYLEALAVVNDLSVGRSELERRCEPVEYQGRKRRALQPLSRADEALFAAALRGEHAIRGFRNGDLAAHLYGSAAKDNAEKRRRCGRVSRLIGLLRAHGLVRQVPHSHRYHVTPIGQRFMSTALHVKQTLYPTRLGAA
jgi:hypothetical protein